MALGFFNALVQGQATGYSGGSEPVDRINPAAIAVMAEKGIDITAEQPKRWRWCPAKLHRSVTLVHLSS